MSAEWIGSLSGAFWQYLMLPLVFCGGLYFSIKSRGLQFVRFKTALKEVFGSLFAKRKAEKGSVTPFQALSTALAGTVGTGSIVGSCQAVAMGGYGAVFWMVAASFLGMIVKFFEVTLAVCYRRKSRDGEWLGGPMVTLRYGMKKGGRFLGAAFALFALFASFGMGNLAQSNSIAAALTKCADTFSPLSPSGEKIFSLAVGISVALILGFAVFGGMGRIGKISERLVPGMCLLFLVLAAGVVLKNISLLPAVFHRIVRDAFSVRAVGGAGTGVGMLLALEWGLKRSAFSNEAGLGSSAVAHAAADVDHPVKQGLFGIFEVFADTTLISVITCLAILTATADERLFACQGPDATLITEAFADVYGKGFAAIFIGISLTLFAFSTLLGWSLTGRRCAEFLFGASAGKPYLVLFVLLSALGAVFSSEIIWSLSDLFNALMAIPNFVSLFAMKNTVLSLARDYFSPEKAPLPVRKRFDRSHTLC